MLTVDLAGKRDSSGGQPCRLQLKGKFQRSAYGRMDGSQPLSNVIGKL
jgi:hypothetical protein